MEIKIYGSKSKIERAIRLIQSMLKIKEGYVPIGMSMLLGKDLKKQGMTR